MRISTTTLESYRLFMEPDQEWMSEQSLIDGILGKFTPNARVILGQAFGAVLEDPDRYHVPGGYVCQGYSFGEDVMRPAFALIDRAGVFEAKAQKRYGACDVVAKADHLIGAHLSEFKTTTSTFDFDKYAASCQWRFMVDIFQPSSVTYHVFCLEEEDDLSDTEDQTISIRSIESFNLYPYPGLHEDCCDLLRQFVAYVTTKGLDGFLRDRQVRSEAA